MSPTAAPAAAQNSLAQLRDIHLPEPISWWPLAPSLWIVLILIIAALLAASWLLYKKHKNNRYRRQALKQLNQQVTDYQQHQQQQSLCQQLLTTLRCCLLSGDQRRAATAVNQSAAELLQQLNRSMNKALFSDDLCKQIQQLAYAAQPAPLSDSQLNELLNGARTCIRRLP